MIAEIGGKWAEKRPINRNGETGWFWKHTGRRLVPSDEWMLDQRTLWP